MTVSRLRDIPGIGVDVIGDAADAAADPDILRLENLDTDLRPPPAAVELTRAAVDDAANSYLPFQGHRALREAAAAHVGRLAGRRYDPGSECVVVAGGLNGILNALLATALGVSLGELLEPPAPGVAVVRAGEGPRADGDAVHARLLHRIALRGTVEVYAIEVDAVQQASQAHLPGVAECLVVTGGAIRTGPAGAPVDLAEGDSVHFGAASPHLYRGLGGRGSAVLLMLHPAGPARPGGTGEPDGPA